MIPTEDKRELLYHYKCNRVKLFLRLGLNNLALVLIFYFQVLGLTDKNRPR